jgi:hypothetical protein
MAKAFALAYAVPVRRNRYQHERDLVDGAIALVGGGGAPRVSLVIQHGAVILRGAQAIATRRGVIVRAVRRPGHSGCDVVVEPIA